MLELVSIYFATIMVAAVTVKLYRIIFGWHGINHILTGARRTTMKMKINAQQGYITLVPDSQMKSDEPVQLVVLYSGGGALLAPWGW